MNSCVLTRHCIYPTKVQKGYKLLLKKIKLAFPEKKAYLHIMSFISTIVKVSQKSVEWFQRICADKKNRTDGLTD